MTRKLFTVTILIIILLSACVPATVAPIDIVSITDTPILTSTWTQTFTIAPTASETPTSTSTPIHFQEGRFRIIGPQDYYSDPALRKTVGRWKDSFFVCTRYYFKDYDSYEIAATEVDCINRNPLGWVSTRSVILGTGRYDGLSIAPPPDARQCEDGLDNDLDTLIDYPSDPECDDKNDDWENATPPITNTPIPPPGSNMKVSAPGQVTCQTGQPCKVPVTVRNAPPGNICVYVKPPESNQPYYFQFEGTSGKANLGDGDPVKDTPFVIYAVAISSRSCPGGQQSGIPSGVTASTTTVRKNQ